MTAIRHYTGCKTICHSSSLFLIAYPPQNVRMRFSWKLWTGRSEFPVGIRPVFINLPRETGVRKFFWSLENDVWVNIKEKFAWNNCGCLLNFSEGNVPKPGNETRSVRPSRKYRFKYLNFGNSNRNFWSNWTDPIYISTTKRPITA